VVATILTIASGNLDLEYFRSGMGEMSSRVNCGPLLVRFSDKKISGVAVPLQVSQLEDRQSSRAILFVSYM
jgi:hypothetical protein